VKLPLAEAAHAEPAPAAKTLPPAPGKRVLVVDDNDDAALMLSMMLQRVGYATTTAHDGMEALAAARELAPQVVILDIGMPGMSGYDVAQIIRREAQLKDTVLIALTGWGTHEDKRKAFEAGFDVHLTKPVDADDLQNVLASPLRARPPSG
jgi:CheY-like chemotaxis protein